MYLAQFLRRKDAAAYPKAKYGFGSVRSRGHDFSDPLPF